MDRGPHGILMSCCRLSRVERRIVLKGLFYIEIQLKFEIKNSE